MNANKARQSTRKGKEEAMQSKMRMHSAEKEQKNNDGNYENKSIKNPSRSSRAQRERLRDFEGMLSRSEGGVKAV
jgi:hypothetical protein